MTILDLDTNHPIEGVLESGEIGKNYRLILNRLNLDELAAIRDTIDEIIGDSQIQTAGWMPGRDWRGTPLQVLHDTVARGNENLAAKLFGIMVWEAFERHEGEWYTGRFELNGEEIGSRTYFQKGT